MPEIFKLNDITYDEHQSDLEPYDWFSSQRLSAIGKSEDLYFNVRKLDPGKYSFPYHFHRNSEELFIIFEGSATLRTIEGLQIVTKGDIVFFEKGPESAHQLFNHTDRPCIYFDLRTNNGFDVSEMPDSNKLLILPEWTIIEKGDEAEYYKGEENADEIWNKLKDKQKG